ncbi:MAG: MATE family efflux transporter [Thermoplasmata archaeon]|nr:MATE family efflux transporter [Thermoplasmata archaeon]
MPSDELKKRLLRLAWPAVFMNLFQTLAMTVDIMMVGRIGGRAVGAVTLGTQLMFLVMMVFMTITAGTIALMARFTGSGEREERGKALSQSLTIALLFSVPIGLMGVLFSGTVVSVYGATPAVATLAGQYVRVVFLAAPVFAVIAVSSSAFIAAGDTRTPLWVNGSMNLVNVVFNYLLIFGKFGFPRMGVEGAAWGTLISFVWAAAVYIALLSRKSGKFNLSLSSLVPEKRMMGRIMRIGVPAAGEQLAIQVGFLAYMVLVVHFGETALAAHGIGMRITGLVFMPSMGFAVAATALTGQYLGKGEPEMAERAGWMATKLCAATMIGLGIVMFFLAPHIARAFISEEAVIDKAVMFIRILAAGTPAIAIHFTLAGALRGAGDTRYPLLATTLGLYGVRLPLAIFLGFFTPLGIYGVWFAMIAEYNARSSVILRRFYSGGWKSTEV